MNLKTLQEVASELNLHPGYLRNAIHRGQLKATKYADVWLISVREMTRFANAERHPGRPHKQSKEIKQ